MKNESKIYDLTLRFLGGEKSAKIYSIGIFTAIFLSFIANSIRLVNGNISIIIYFIASLGYFLSMIYLIYRCILLLIRKNKTK